MDVQYPRSGIVFTWDALKAAKNQQKHGVAFEDAVETFFDPRLRVVDASQSDERRLAIIGLDLRLRLLYVVHAEVNESFRLISARRATKMETKVYES